MRYSRFFGEIAARYTHPLISRWKTAFYRMIIYILVPVPSLRHGKQTTQLNSIKMRDDGTCLHSINQSETVEHRAIVLCTCEYCLYKLRRVVNNCFTIHDDLFFQHFLTSSRWLQVDYSETNLCLSATTLSVYVF